MRIVVNDIAASCGGALTILRQFYDFVRESDCENEWIFLLSADYLEETDNIKVITFPQIKKSGFRKIVFDCFSGRYYINNLQPDVVLSMQNIITFGVKVPQAVYVHQSIPFQDQKKFSFFKKEEREIAKVQHIIGSFIIKSVQKADAVFVQTEWMKKSVSKKAKISESKITTVFPKTRKIPTDPSQFDCKTFFYPTNSEIYKNTFLLVEACTLLNEKGIDDFEIYITLPKETVLHKNIKCIGRLDEKQMDVYYQKSTLLFPSYIETVGLPLLEARSCGAIIISSDTPFAHECLRKYENAYFCQYKNADEFAEQMEKVLTKRITPNKSCCFENASQTWELLYKSVIDLPVDRRLLS